MESYYKDYLQCSGTGEFHFALSKFSTLAENHRRFEQFGSLPRLAYEPRNDGEDVTRFGRNGPQVVGRRPNGAGMKYPLTLSELGTNQLWLMTMHDPNYDWGAVASDNAQTALSAVAGQPFDFDEGDAGLGVKAGMLTPLFTTTGLRVAFPTAVTLAGVETVYGPSSDSTALVAGVDFELDQVTGKIHWLRDINDDVITPTITAPEITSSSPEYMIRAKAMSGQQIKGFADIYIHAKGGPANFHSHIGAFGTLYITGGFEVGENGQMRPTAEFTVHKAGIVEQRINES
ncbi:MAG: hypothetical protein E1N59_2831 [Puniceicoccaceae bacterium 5H]|nr:MAG: hypothetical protein E1N59_2831 [Puniceicoccaceae bacterium 5H]